MKLMKSKNKRNALRSLVMSTVLVTSVAVSTVPVSAANAELPIAQYVSASGDAQCGTSPETATYTGKVTLKVPLTKIMEANEANMKLAADNGAYPWNKEKTGIAYITYDVTFPEEVQFGNISATETSSTSVLLASYTLSCCVSLPISISPSRLADEPAF